MKDMLKLVVPPLLIPFTLVMVNSFGHQMGNIIIGISFFIGAVLFAKGRERRFMFILLVLAALFEALNVAAGEYKYTGDHLVPVWVAMGWGVLGLYLVKNLPLERRLDDRVSYALAAVLFLGIWVAYGMDPASLPTSLFGIAAVYVLTISGRMPAAFFLLTSLFGVFIEYSGTSMGVWTYFDGATGLPIRVPLATLGMAYAIVMGFCLWTSGLGDEYDKKGSAN